MRSAGPNNEALMLMRSKLFVPGSRPELFPKAAASAADALSFDLEDAVALERKDEARVAVASFLSTAALPGKVVVVRVNAVGTAFYAADIAAVAAARVDVVNLPMVEDISAVHEAVRLIDRFEPEGGRGHIRLLVNIETPKALRKAHELAAAMRQKRRDRYPLIRGLVRLYHRKAVLRESIAAGIPAGGQVGILGFKKWIRALFERARNPTLRLGESGG